MSQYIPEVWFDAHGETGAKPEPGDFLDNGALVSPEGERIELEEGQKVAFMFNEGSGWFRLKYFFDAGRLGLME